VSVVQSPETRLSYVNPALRHAVSRTSERRAMPTRNCCINMRRYPRLAEDPTCLPTDWSNKVLSFAAKASSSAYVEVLH
jgi:hypothetical protein